ncbi:MAG: GAF domain-containing protein [Desulfobacterota bacterium]|nr:GAF domain-containing protein [Thermodesulfobacteriota bacterium]
MDMEAKSFLIDSFREVVKSIHSSLDLHEVLRSLVTKVVEVMKVKGCSLYLLDRGRRRLELVATQGLSDRYLLKGPVDADRSIAETMEGKTVWIPDASQDPRVQYRDEAKEEGIVGILSLPLTVGGQVIGALRLYSSEPRSFSPEEIGFLKSLSEMGAIAIENAKKYETIRKDYEFVVKDLYHFYGYRRSL